MQIIFEHLLNNDIRERYTLLELDTVNLPGQGIKTAYAVLEYMNINEIPEVEQYLSLHKNLMENYRKKNWKFCEDAIDHLRNRWGGQLKSFYTILGERVAKYKEADPGPEWTGVYDAYPSKS
jgi:hypothetical protein